MPSLISAWVERRLKHSEVSFRTLLFRYDAKSSYQCWNGCSEDFGISFLPLSLSLFSPVASISSCVCSKSISSVSTGGGQRLSWEGEWNTSLNAVSRWSLASALKNLVFSSAGISSSFCLNSRNSHVLRWNFLTERKWRDGYNCRCRDLITRNQGNVEEM